MAEAAVRTLPRPHSQVINHYDAWQNFVTGFGTTRDKTVFTAFVGIDHLDDRALSNLYHGDDTAQRMVNVVPEEAMREGFDVDLGDAMLNQEIADQCENMEVFDKIADAMRWARCFGGSALVIGADDGRSSAAPLEAERAPNLAYLYVVDRRFISPLTWYTKPGHAKLGQPETYFVSSPTGHTEESSAIIHESRLIRFGGAPTAPLEREIRQSWDYSVLQAAFETLRSFNTGWKSLEILLSDGFQAVFKMAGLKDALAADDDTNYVQTRLSELDKHRSVARALVVDAGSGTEGDEGESFERQSISLAGVPDSLDKLMLRLASAVQTPVTILMGQSPAGMNATGTSDFRWFYDRIKSMQKLKLAPKVKRIIRVMLASKQYATYARKRGDERLNIGLMFPQLWTETPLEEATTRKMVIDGDVALVAAQIFQPETVALVRGQPGGFSKDIVLDDKARKATEDTLGKELDLMVKLAGEPPPPPPPPGGGFGGGGGGGFGKPKLAAGAENAPPPEL